MLTSYLNDLPSRQTLDIFIKTTHRSLLPNISAKRWMNTPVDGSRAFACFLELPPLWYMLIAITPRVRYRPTARCARCTVSSLFSAVPRVTDRGEFRQLSANLLNSNLTGSHLPPLVPPYTLYPRPSSKSTGLTLPRIELYRRPETLSPPSPRFLTLPCPVFSTPFQVTRRKRRFVDSSRWDRGWKANEEIFGRERRKDWKE